MQKKQPNDVVKFFWFINGVEKLIIGIIIIGFIGIVTFKSNAEEMSVPALVLMELAILALGASVMGLLFYRTYSSYQNFINSKNFRVTGGTDLLKNLSPSFWDGKAIASFSFTVDVPKEEGVEVRKAINGFVTQFVQAGNKKFRGDFSVLGWNVKGQITLGKSSNFLLSQLMTNLNAIHEKFPRSAFWLTISITGESIINPSGEESSDETWAEARYRHLEEQRSHDDDFGGSHGHRH